jgi:cell division cycle 2-like protein
MGSARSYEETRKLGKRGYAAVSKARHRATGQTVALKALEHPRGSAAVDTLLREACFMAACRGHPNAVALHGIVRAPGTGDYSIAMEHVGPTTLEDVLRDRVSRLGRPFTEAEVRGIMRQLLSAAAAMHGHCIIHQDIKSDSIFVGGSDKDKDGAALVVKIGNYGLAMSTAEPDPNRFAGKMEYMAPEILLWRPDYGTRVDTWSLGCVMAELLTGEKLFEKADLETDQLYKIFDLLGVPGKKACKEFKSPFSFVTDEVDLWRREQQQRGRQCSRLREIFPEKTLSKEGFEVLNGLLTCPNKRLDAAAALQLPWFAHTDHHTPAPVVTAVSKSASRTTSIWAMALSSWHVAFSCFERALRSVRLAQEV